MSYQTKNVLFGFLFLVGVSLAYVFTKDIWLLLMFVVFSGLWMITAFKTLWNLFDTDEENISGKEK